MLRKPLKILAVNPGSRYLGVAVFKGSQLKDWGIKVNKGGWSKERMRKNVLTVTDFIEEHKANVLAIKKLHRSRSSPNLNRLVSRLKQASKRRGLKVYQYSIDDLKAFFSPKGRINKRKMAEMVATEFPFLFHELEKEKTRRNLYHLRMFEAVALGATCFHQLDNRYKCQRINQKY